MFVLYYIITKNRVIFYRSKQSGHVKFFADFYIVKSNVFPACPMSLIRHRVSRFVSKTDNIILIFSDMGFHLGVPPAILDHPCVL